MRNGLRSARDRRATSGAVVRLTEDLLDLARIAEGRIHLAKQTVALAGTVARALDSVRPVLEQREHELSTSLPTSPIFIEADPARLQSQLRTIGA
jgi:two-component system CheB/CheR fusion protein